MPANRSKANHALARAIRSTREQRGYRQESFAARVGLDRSNYGAIERGECNVTVDTVIKRATALGVSAGELFSRAGI
jgi:transcriptional regulator with XRE-family HTH domain